MLQDGKKLLSTNSMEQLGFLKPENVDPCVVTIIQKLTQGRLIFSSKYSNYEPLIWLNMSEPCLTKIKTKEIIPHIGR